MGENSHIQWTDHTFNPWRGCTKVSPGCAHCYAETLSLRCGKSGVGPYVRGGKRQRTSADNWKKPLKWNQHPFGVCERCGPRYDEAREGRCPGCSRVDLWQPRRQRVFCASLSDWLDDEVPIEWLADLLTLIHATPNLDWLLLTKRPQNWMPRMLAAFDHLESEDAKGWLESWLAAAATGPLAGVPPANVWLMATAEDQPRAIERTEQLLKIPAVVRGLSMEPLLGPVDFYEVSAAWPMEGHPWKNTPILHGIDWVICGGESGGKARPMQDEWARSLRDQCADAGTAFFMKQMGGVRDARGNLEQMPADLRVREFPAHT